MQLELSNQELHTLCIALETHRCNLQKEFEKYAILQASPSILRKRLQTTTDLLARLRNFAT